jgi:hypothetical protein
VKDKLYPNADKDEQEEQLPNLQVNNLKGKTIEVYQYMISEGKQYYGVREIQRDLEYSSPSIASYHLNRLCEYKLAKKSPDGMYFIEGDPVRLGSIETHVKVMGLMVPRLILYGINSLFTILIAGILYFSHASLGVWFGFIVISNLIIIGMVIRDSLKITNKLKLEEKQNEIQA